MATFNNAYFICIQITSIHEQQHGMFCQIEVKDTSETRRSYHTPQTQPLSFLDPDSSHQLYKIRLNNLIQQVCWLHKYTHLILLTLYYIKYNILLRLLEIIHKYLYDDKMLCFFMGDYDISFLSFRSIYLYNSFILSKMIPKLFQHPFRAS